MSDIQEMIWSPQQESFQDFCLNGKGSGILVAVAGAGKTTTILRAVQEMAGSSAILAYNKKIAEEIKDKLKKLGVDWKKAEAGTVHSFGFRAYAKAFPGVQVNGNKLAELAEKMTEDQLFPSVVTPYSGAMIKLASLAKQRAIGVTTSIDNTSAWNDIWDHFDILADADDENVPVAQIIEAAQLLLKRSNREVMSIDFDDMVYLPLIHHVKFWGYDNVFVDEAQDTNPARRALVGALTKKGGRVIAVGDPHQAIYGFTGADNDSLDLIQRDFNAVKLPLTITYRCPKKVVEFAKRWVNHIEAGETAPEGTVSSITMEDLMVRKDLNATSAILCRNTKPLVELAFSLIRNKIACKVEGRDIGMGLKKLATRWKAAKTLNALENKLADYEEKQKARFIAKKQENAAQVIEDQCETLRVIISQCRAENKHDVVDLVNYIDSLFSDDVTGVLVLSTIHKSKGREWENVFWLDRLGTCPSKWARQAWQIDQENNLCYVAATRAKANLIEVVLS